MFKQKLQNVLPNSHGNHESHFLMQFEMQLSGTITLPSKYVILLLLLSESTLSNHECMSLREKLLKTKVDINL